MKAYFEQHVLTSIVWSLVLVVMLGGIVRFFPDFPGWLLLLMFLYGQILLGGLTNPAKAVRHVHGRLDQLIATKGCSPAELRDRAQRLQELKLVCGEMIKEDRGRSMTWVDLEYAASRRKENIDAMLRIKEDTEALPVGTFNDRLKAIGAWCHARAGGAHNQQTTASMLHQRAAKLAGKTYKQDDKHHR